MMLRTLLAVALWVTLAGMPAAGRQLTVVSRGPTLLQAQDEVLFKPFTTTTGVPVDPQEWAGGIGFLRSRIEGGGNDWDLAQVSGGELLAGCDDGLFEKLPWPALGGRERFLPQGTSDCGLGLAVGSIVLAWDRDKFTATPSWADFWDVARYPGKRGLRRTARSNLEIALMADGVAGGDTYRLLRTDEGVDRAFRKLDQIKPYLSWWTPDQQAAQFLGSGEVLLSSADSVSIALANRTQKRHFGLQWAGSLYSILSWAVMKGSPNTADAIRLLSFIADPARQAGLATAVPYGTTVKGANELVPPDSLATSPTAPANLGGALQIDEQFWYENGDKLSQRFEAWLAH